MIALPRTFENSHVVQIHLKRKLEYAHNFMTETIRQARVLEALRYLINTDLYLKHNISVASNWLGVNAHNEEVPFVADPADITAVDSLLRCQKETDSEGHDTSDLNPGGQETLLDNDSIENNAMIGRIAMAPGEGRRSIDITTDEDTEELSFPTISCGEICKSKSTYCRKAKSQIRYYDRRCAKVPKMLYMYKCYELTRIKSSISICLRKKLAKQLLELVDSLSIPCSLCLLTNIQWN